MKKTKRERGDSVNPNGVLQRIKEAFYAIGVAAHKRMPHKKQRSVSKGNKSEWLFVHLLLLLPLVQFAIMYVYVNFNSILLAFQTYNVFKGKFELGAGFDNFKNVFAELFSSTGTLGIAFGNSIKMYLVSLLIVCPLALLFSYYMFKKIKFTEVFRVVLFLPSIISPVILVSIFSILVDQGIPSLMQKISGGQLQLGLLSRKDSCFTTIMFYYVVTSFGVNVLMYTNAMSQISVSVIEAAELDGASFLREFVSICLPLIYPTITTFLTVGIVDIFVGQANLYSFFGGSAEKYVYTIGYYLYVLVYDKGSTIEMYPFAAAMGVVFSVVAIPVTLTLRWAFEKFGPQTEQLG